MRTLPTTMIRLLAPFVPLFSKRVWQHAQVLLVGAILAPSSRTVSSALRAMGLDREKRFHRYDRVLSRASWSKERTFYGSRAQSDTIKVPRAYLERLTQAVCYAA